MPKKKQSVPAAPVVASNERKSDKVTLRLLKNEYIGVTLYLAGSNVTLSTEAATKLVQLKPEAFTYA